MSIPLPLYSTVITGMKNAIDEVRVSESAINTALDFEISINRSRPYIESVNNKALVNILLNKVAPDRERSSKHNKIHMATYYFDMYVRGSDSDLIPADETAVLRLHLLTAQIEFALTAMKNARFGLPVGQIDSRIDLDLEFYTIEDDRESTSPFAPARFIMVCYFPYNPEDVQAPGLTSVNIKLLEEWNIKFNYT